jgi:hypothetical protein
LVLRIFLVAVARRRTGTSAGPHFASRGSDGAAVGVLLEVIS